MGTLDAFYLRPLPLLAQLVTSDLTLKRLARISVAAVALAAGAAAQRHPLGHADAAAAGGAWSAGTAIFAGLFVCAASLQFFLVNGAELTSSFTAAGPTPRPSRPPSPRPRSSSSSATSSPSRSRRTCPRWRSCTCRDRRCCRRGPCTVHPGRGGMGLADGHVPVAMGNPAPPRWRWLTCPDTSRSSTCGGALLQPSYCWPGAGF